MFVVGDGLVRQFMTSVNSVATLSKNKSNLIGQSGGVNCLQCSVPCGLQISSSSGSR